MNARALDISPTPGEYRAAARRKRLFQLQKIVWELMFERFHKMTFKDYDASEDGNLIAALRACSLFVEQIEFIGWLEPLVFRIEGFDGNEYILGFELRELGFKLFAARGESSSLSMTKEKCSAGQQLTIFQELSEFVDELTLGEVTIDRAFLVGMSMIIGLMNSDDDDDRLLPLLKQITPTTPELDTIAARTRPPTIVLDDDDPY